MIGRGLHWIRTWIPASAKEYTYAHTQRWDYFHGADTTGLFIEGFALNLSRVFEKSKSQRRSLDLGGLALKISDCFLQSGI